MSSYRHSCGHLIWIDWKWNGLEYYPVIYARRFGREDEVESCPKCGEVFLPRFDIEEGNLKEEVS